VTALAGTRNLLMTMT